MKILFLTFSDSGVSGVREYFDQTAESLIAAGHEVSCFVLTGNEDIIEDCRRRTAYETYRLPLRSKIAWLIADNIFDPFLYRQLQRKLTDFRPDIVHLHDIKSWPTVYRACRRLPTVWTAHYLSAIHPLYELPGLPQNSFTGLTGKIWRNIKNGALPPMRLLIDYLLLNKLRIKRKLTVTVCPSQTVIAAALRHGLRDCALLPHFSRLRLPTTLAEDYFLYAGRLDEQKGIIALLEAFLIAHRKNNLLRLILAGTGPLENHVKDYISKNGLSAAVTMAGLQDAAGLTGLYGRAIAGIVPSISAEAGPLAAIEALSCGKAVIASAVGGSIDVIKDGQNGLLVEANNAPALAAALLRLQNDLPLARALGKAGRAAYEANFSEALHLAKLEKIYQAAMADSNDWQLRLLSDAARKKIVLSPHFDDLPLSVGGLARAWQESGCEVEDWIVFSQGNYVFGDPNGNKDHSLKRRERISALRLAEEQAAADELGISRVIALGCAEAAFRGHSGYLADSEKRYAPTAADDAAARLLRQAVMPLLSQPIDLYIPLAFLGHFDHLLVREALSDLLLARLQTAAAIYFYEDLPYVAEANWRQMRQMRLTMRRFRLRPLYASIDLAAKLRLLAHYRSQSDPSYPPAVSRRALALQKKHSTMLPLEIIYRATDF